MFSHLIKKKDAILFVLAAFVIIMSTPQTGISAIPKNTVTYADGLISIQYSGKKLGYLLDEIAEMLSITVYLYDNSGSEIVTISIEDRDPVDALRSILRNRNYCIVFNEASGMAGVERLYGLTGKPSRSFGLSRRRTTNVKTGNSALASVRNYVDDEGSENSTLSAGNYAEDGQGKRTGVMQNGRNRVFSDGGGRDQSPELDNSYDLQLSQTDVTESEGLSGSWEEEVYDNNYEQASDGSQQDSSSYYAKVDDDYWETEDANYSKTGDDYWETEDASYGTNDAYNDQDSKIASLESQIENIQEQIESGEADRWYEKWSNIKGEKYITHPQENLARLEEKLEELLYGG
jgi:hypothetical protein